ncbi:MAG: hypothetical protein J6R00_01210 [Lentisphaeria bacterium]|nr:hypothetical protein [Lentisphaeria bacterium]
MPELPEVENIGRALKKALVGKRILKTEIFTLIFLEKTANILYLIAL